MYLIDMSAYSAKVKKLKRNNVINYFIWHGPLDEWRKYLFEYVLCRSDDLENIDYSKYVYLISKTEVVVILGLQS